MAQLPTVTVCPVDDEDDGPSPYAFNENDYCAVCENHNGHSFFCETLPHNRKFIVDLAATPIIENDSEK